MKFKAKAQLAGGVIVGDEIEGQIIYKPSPYGNATNSPGTAELFVAYFAGGYWSVCRLVDVELL